MNNAYVKMASQLKASETKKVSNLKKEIERLETKIASLVEQKNRLSATISEKEQIIELDDETLAVQLQEKQRKAQQEAILRKAAEIQSVEQQQQ